MSRNIGCVIQNNWARPEKSKIDAFRGCAVANLDDCMNRTAAVSSRIRPMNHAPLLGSAFTVKVAQGDNLMFHKAMDMAQQGDVVVIDAGGFTDRAILGELMITYCKSRGLAGVIVDGSIRDSDAIAEMNFPVYAAGISPNGPYKNGPGEIGTVISFGGQVVRPGDIVIGDGDGILIIQPEDADDLLAKVRQVQSKEEEILKKIQEKGEYIRPWVDQILDQIGCER